MTIRKSLQALCTQFADIKYLAQKSIICQLKSLYHKSKDKANLLSQVNLKELAFSHGLIQVPKVSFNKSVVQQETPQVVVKGNKKSRKLEKLKRKIKLKKQRQKDNREIQLDDVYLLKNMGDQINELRENPISKRGQHIIEVEDIPLDSILKKKQGPVILDKLDIKKVELSKRRLKKIKHDGPYGGKNLKNIDDQGKLVERSNTFKDKFKGGDLVDRVGQFKSKLGKFLIPR